MTGGSEYVGNDGTGAEGETAGTGSMEPGGSVRLSLFFDICRLLELMVHPFLLFFFFHKMRI